MRRIARLSIVTIITLSCVSGVPAGVIAKSPVDTNISQTKMVESLIVRYGKGVKPRSKVPITGTEYVTSVKRSALSLGKLLGFRMYQVDFSTPISLSVARRVAAQMTKSSRVEFAEPNGRVSINVNSA
jgi:hypothetical protein